MNCWTVERPTKKLPNSRRANPPLDIKQVRLFDIRACKCVNFEKCSCDKSGEISIKERKFLVNQQNLPSLFIGEVDTKETARLNKNFHGKEIKKAKKQRTIFAGQYIPSKVNPDLCDDIEKKVYNSEDNPRILIAYINSPKKSNQMRNNLKLFAETGDTFKLPNTAASALSSALLRDFEFLTLEKTKSGLYRLSNGKRFN